jgi:hypothetical protein
MPSLILTNRYKRSFVSFNTQAFRQEAGEGTLKGSALNGTETS